MTENKRFNTLLSRNGKYKYIDDKERTLTDRHGQIQGYLIQEDHEENVDLLVKFLNQQEQSIQQWRKSNDCFANKLETAEKEIQQLKLIINGLNYALKNIRQIDVEIDLNECGDVEFVDENERVTVDFDEESYYLDGEYWESWDSYGEEMADKINKLLNEQEERIKELEKENKRLKQGKYIYGIHGGSNG